MPAPTPAPKSGMYGLKGRLYQPKVEPKVEPKKPAIGKRAGSGVSGPPTRVSRPPAKVCLFSTY